MRLVSPSSPSFSPTDFAASYRLTDPAMGSEMILILEDNDERIAAFESVVARLEPRTDLRVWRDAHTFMAEAGSFLPRSVLISLDHDVNRMPGS